MRVSFRGRIISSEVTKLYPLTLYYSEERNTRLIQHINDCFNLAEQQISKINENIINLPGMSGYKTRHLYNNLLSIEDARYLEIGVWKGSSTCSAMFKNNATVVAIDNFSEFGGPKEEFLSNFNKFKSGNNAIFIESDCFKVDISTLPKFNVYLYDGNHDHDSHYNALSYYLSNMDDTFIYIVDDWNWKSVRSGTHDAIHKLRLNLVYSREVRTTNDDTHPPNGSTEKSMWHNGVFVAIIKK